MVNIKLLVGNITQRTGKQITQTVSCQFLKHVPLRAYCTTLCHGVSLPYLCYSVFFPVSPCRWFGESWVMLCQDTSLTCDDCLVPRASVTHTQCLLEQMSADQFQGQVFVSSVKVCIHSIRSMQTAAQDRNKYHIVVSE